MSLRERVTKVLSLIFPVNRSWWTAGLGRTTIDYSRYVGDGRSNAIVSACLLWVARTFPEAPVRVQRRTANGLEAVPNHAMLELLARPNPYYSGVLLWTATITDWMLGNAYWIKQRSKAGRVVQLWWVPSRQMKPVGTEREYLSHYEYDPQTGDDPVKVPPSEVVHFRNGFDPHDIRSGLSPLGSLVREVFTDDEAANWTAALLRNVGVPGVIISPREQGIQPEQAKQVKDQFEQSFGNDNRGRAMVMHGPTEIKTLSFSPEQMQLTQLRRLPEERISAIFGIPAIVTGLGAGLERSTFSNYAEAREAAYESNIIPTQRLLAAEIQAQLLPDFEGEAAAGFVVDFDNSNIRVLQEDQNALVTRLVAAWDAGLMKRSEARAVLGLEVTDEDEVYKTEAAAPDPTALPAPAADEDEDEPEAEELGKAVERFLARLAAAGMNGHGH